MVSPREKVKWVESVVLQDKAVRAVSVRGGHVGRGLNRVRGSCVDILGSVFQA